MDCKKHVVIMTGTGKSRFNKPQFFFLIYIESFFELFKIYVLHLKTEGWKNILCRWICKFRFYSILYFKDWNLHKNEYIFMLICINTSYLTDSYIVFTLKMEFQPKNIIFGVKMMMKSGLEKNILKFLHAQAIFF